MWACSSNQEKDWIERKKKKSWPSTNKNEFFLPDCLQTQTLFSSCLWTPSEASALPGYSACFPSDRNYTIGSSGSQVFGFGLELHHLSVQFTDCRSLYLLDSIITWTNYYWLCFSGIPCFWWGVKNRILSFLYWFWGF